MTEAIILEADETKKPEVDNLDEKTLEYRSQG